MGERTVVTANELRKDPMELIGVLCTLMEPLPLPMSIAVFCTVIDQMCANNDMTSEETVSLYEDMWKTAKSAHELFGMPQKME